jgi:hypothetical protein
MSTTDRIELIEPAHMGEGDVVEDPARGCRLTGPDDRITVGGIQKPRRRGM